MFINEIPRLSHLKPNNLTFVSMNGPRKLICHQTKRLTAGQSIGKLFSVQKVQNCSPAIISFYIAAWRLIIRILGDDKCTFCHSEAESLLHLFWKYEITQGFGISIFSCLKFCQIMHIFPQVHTAIVLRPYS